MADLQEITRLYNSLIQQLRRRHDVSQNDGALSPTLQHHQAAVFSNGARRLTKGLIAGAFDCIHPGYIKAFIEAKANCDYLFVCVHKDPSVENPEKMKPVLSIQEREEILRSIRYVDEVVFYETEADLMRLLKMINPDIRFLGQDYDMGIKAITGRELNIPIHFLDRSHGWSATKYKKLICESLER